jgi:hypothetical protein
MLKAGTTLNIHLLRANKQVNRADFQLNLDVSSILNEFESIDKQNLESIQVNYTFLYVKK